MVQYLEAGKILGPHGVRGEMKLEVWGDDLKALKQSGRVYFSSNGGEAVKITALRAAGPGALLSLEGIQDMDAARRLLGKVIYLDRNDFRLPAGRYFLQDLIGCRVEDADTARVYGVIEDVSHPGAQDIFAVKTPEGKICFLPDVPAFVAKKLPEEQKVLVTPIPGLFEEAENGDGEGGKA